ncbi:MAG: EamA family transporter [Acidobacteriaceae bacterium]
MSGAGMTAGLSLASATIWGTSDFIGGIAAQRIRSSAVVAISHALSLAVLVAVALATRAALPDAGPVLYGVAAGAAGGVGVIFLYKALALGSMGITAALSGVLAAALPVVWAFATEGLPRPRRWIGFAVAAVAIWMIARAPGARSSAQGLMLGAAAGISFGFLFILLKLAGHGGVLWPLACARVVSASLAAVITLVSMRRGRAGESTMTASLTAAPPIAPGAAPDMERNARTAVRGMSWTVMGLAAVAGIFDAGGNVFYTIATQAGRLDIAAVLSSLYPAGTILLAALVLKEHTTHSQKAGMGLALVAVALISA